MLSTDAVPPTFARLRSLLTRFAPSLLVTTDRPDRFSLDAPPSARIPDGLFFGEVRIGKRNLNFHLMPVYLFPELLASIGPALARKKRGKSCCNVMAIDDAAVAELEALNAAGFTRYRTEGIVG